jgi:hypothetical protein
MLNAIIYCSFSGNIMIGKVGVILERVGMRGALMDDKKWFKITPVMMAFAHDISADKIIILRRDNLGRTLLSQLEDKINEEIKKQKI